MTITFNFFQLYCLFPFHLAFFVVVLSCSLIWDIFLCLLILSNFLCFCILGKSAISPDFESDALWRRDPVVLCSAMPFAFQNCIFQGVTYVSCVCPTLWLSCVCFQSSQLQWPILLVVGTLDRVWSLCCRGASLRPLQAYSWVVSTVKLDTWHQSVCWDCSPTNWQGAVCASG